MIWLIRHADAGLRSHGPEDRRRPLSPLGIQQAESLADRMGDAGVERLLASPYQRCIETLQPLGKALGLVVEEEPALAEGSPPEPLVTMFDEIEPGGVLCSHGDVLGSLVGHLHAAGAPLDPRQPFEKAATWELTMDGRRVVSARYLPPPG